MSKETKEIRDFTGAILIDYLRIHNDVAYEKIRSGEWTQLDLHRWVCAILDNACEEAYQEGYGDCREKLLG